MTNALLQTKLHIPLLRSSLVPRPRLIDRLNKVRELRNVLERAVVVSADRVITLRDLPPSITRARGPISSVSIPLGTTLAEAERMLIGETISFARGNKSKAAQILGLSRKGVYNKLGRYTVSHGSTP